MTLSGSQKANLVSRSLTLKLVQSMLDLNEEAKQELSKSDTFDFNIFKLREYTNGRELEAIHLHLAVSKNCISRTNTDINKMSAFLTAIQAGYKNITYHNKTHGADLCQNINMFMQTGGLAEKLKLDELEYLGVLTAAVCHDYQHPGVNNAYLTKVQDPIAIRHNDTSVLESHHIAASFELMMGNPAYNWAYKF
jgi:hypothetical protein